MPICRAYGLRFRIDPPLPNMGSFTNGPADVDVSLSPRSWPLAPQPAADEDLRYTSESSGNARPNLRIFAAADGRWWRLLFADGVQFAVSHDGSAVHADWPALSTIEDAATYLPGSVLAFALRVRGVMSLHASAVCIDGKAVLLVGPAGAGKSTLALALHQRGHPVLSEDVVALQPRADGIGAHSGFPHVRLWPDSAQALGRRTDELPRLARNWDKRYWSLAGAAAFQATPAPIGAVYVLCGRRDASDVPSLETATARSALLELLAHTRSGGVSDVRMRAQELDVLSKLARKAPLRWLTPHAEIARVADLAEFIERDVRSAATRPARAAG
jgi:hypothetical protein